LKTFVRRYQVQGLDRPQEFRVFYEGAKVEQKTSLLDILSIKIQLYFEACARDKNKKDRWT